MNVAIIGAGAAGMFCAANLKPEAHADIYEAARFPLRKVLASGGGRCNFTNENIDSSNPADFYPRGGGSLKKPLRKFGAAAAREFFAALKVASKVEDGGRVFPACDSSRAVARALENAARARGARLFANAKIFSVEPLQDGGILIGSPLGEKRYDAAVVCTGGMSDKNFAENFERMGLKIEPPVPSLFALETESGADPDRRALSGISVPLAEISARIPTRKNPKGEKFSARGAVLFTHFGLGGPAVLKFSSLAARAAHEADYKFDFSVNFAPDFSENRRAAELEKARKDFAKKRVANAPLFGVAQKLWAHLAKLSGVAPQTEYASLGKACANSLLENIARFGERCRGRSAHKAEFVTCGGIARTEIDFSTMRCKKIPNLFFAGECLDIDAFTGGFNLQAAWTTAKICAETINAYL